MSTPLRRTSGVAAAAAPPSTPRRTTSRARRSTSTASGAATTTHIGVVCDVRPGLRRRAGARARGRAAAPGRRPGLALHHDAGAAGAGGAAAPTPGPVFDADDRRGRSADAADPGLRRARRARSRRSGGCPRAATAALWPRSWARPTTTSPTATTGWRPASRCGGGRQARRRGPAVRRLPDGRAAPAPPSTAGSPGPVDSDALLGLLGRGLRGPRRSAGADEAPGSLRRCTSTAAGTTSTYPATVRRRRRARRRDPPRPGSWTAAGRRRRTSRSRRRSAPPVDELTAALRRRRRRAVHARAARRSTQLIEVADARRGDAAEDDVLRPEAVRRDLPARLTVVVRRSARGRPRARPRRPCLLHAAPSPSVCSAPRRSPGRDR